MTGYDVIVIGLGGMGSAAAWHLAARGARVLGLERFGPAHAMGSSHGESRIIRQSYFEDPAYVPLLKRSYELFDELDGGLMTLTGGIYLGPPGSTTFAGSLRAALEWDLPHEVLAAPAIRSRFPTLAASGDVHALFEERAGFVRPEATVAEQLRRAAAAGASLHYDEPVLAWSGDGTVTTALGAYQADHLVICPGAWAPGLLADLGVPLRVERLVQFWFRPSAELFDGHPVWIWESAEEEQIYGFPAVRGAVKIAFFRRGTPCTPDTIDRTVHPAEAAEIGSYVRALLPELPGVFLRAAACMYTTTPDQHFVISRHPAHDRVTVACGFSGHGFKFVPVVGEILADLALEGTTRHDIALFDPKRFG